MRPAWLLLAGALLLPGCMKRPPAPAAAAHYVVGGAYQAGGVWRYPREEFRLDATGLAAVLPDRAGLTADGEAFDGTAMAAAHPTLQLPAIALVTNLENGLQLRVRVNDRGPDSPARLIGLTRGAAARLEIAPSGAGRVRVQVEDGPSQALRDQLGGGGGVTVAAAPRGAIASEVLAPPPGVAQSARGPAVRALSPSPSPSSAAPAQDQVADRLPDAVTQVAASPGQLWVRAGEFGRRQYADQVRARIGGLAAVDAVREGRAEVFRVRAGPFGDVAAADNALDQAMQAGVTDAHIVVE